VTDDERLLEKSGEPGSIPIGPASVATRRPGRGRRASTTRAASQARLCRRVPDDVFEFAASIAPTTARSAWWSKLRVLRAQAPDRVHTRANDCHACGLCVSRALRVPITLLAQSGT